MICSCSSKVNSNYFWIFREYSTSNAKICSCSSNIDIQCVLNFETPNVKYNVRFNFFDRRHSTTWNNSFDFY